MARVLLLHGHHRHAVGTALRRQIEIDDLRKLLLQDRHEDFVHRHAQHRRFVRRAAGVGAVVDRVAAVGNAIHGKHREALHFVVVAGVVAERPFVGVLAGLQMAFQHELGTGRHLQVGAQAFHQLGARAAQQAGEAVLAERVRHRRHRAQDGGRVGAQRHRHRERLAGVGLLPFLEIERAAAVAEPAHDQLVAADQLLAIDAQVLTFLIGPAGNHQRPGHQRAGVAWPAGLNRQLGEVHVVAFDDVFLAGPRAAHLGIHAQHLAEDRQLLPGVAEPLGRLRLLQEGQQLAEFAQLFHGLPAHAQRHAPLGAEQIPQHRDRRPLGVFEQNRRTARLQRAVADLGHLQARVHLAGHPLQFAQLFQLLNKVAQVAVFHQSNLAGCKVAAV